MAERETSSGPMVPRQRVGLALVSAFLGWVCANARFFLCQAASLLRSGMTGTWRELLANDAFWAAATGAFTLVVTLGLICPYVLMRSATSMLQRPWRVYLEPALIGVGAMFAFGLRHSASDVGYTLRELEPYLAVAGATSLISSFFYLRALRRGLGGQPPVAGRSAGGRAAFAGKGWGGR